MTDPLITTSELAALLGAQDLRVVDASWFLDGRDGYASYLKTHIPGAVFFDIEAVSDRSSPLPHMLATPAAFAAAVSALGISREDRVVVYDQAGLFSAARVWWNFRVMGAERVQVLDGGLPKWVAEGRPLADVAPSPAPAHFDPAMRPALVLDFNDVRQNIDNPTFQLLDARPALRFRGEATEPRPGLASGHVPGSLSQPFGALLKPDGTMMSAEALRAVLTESGYDPSRPAAVSCGSGVTAPIIALALARLGRWNVPVYDGSWAEWGSRADAPVATGA